MDCQPSTINHQPGEEMLHKATGLLAALLLVGAAGCGPKTEDAGTRGDGETGKKPAAGQVLQVGLVTDAGGIDDQSFNASCWAGVKKAQAEGGVKGKYVESERQSDYKTNLSTMTEQGCGLVFGAGFLMEDAFTEIAPAYPNVKFASIDGKAIVDSATGKPVPNGVGIRFREEEGCFLAGYLAGKMSKTGAVGFVGGMESPLIKKFEMGYYAGAKTANPKIRMIPKYVGDWTDNAKGKEYALAEIREGADILFAAAGKGGLGALDAVAEQGPGYYGIGVDRDQDDLHPGRILTSMMKRVDLAVYQTIEDVKAGKWTSGEKILGLKEGMIHLSPMKYTKKDVPPDVLRALDTLKEMIIAGKIKVPTTEEEMQNFVPPVL
jgi:basic membrane protein A